MSGSQGPLEPMGPASHDSAALRNFNSVYVSCGSNTGGYRSAALIRFTPISGHRVCVGKSVRTFFFKPARTTSQTDWRRTMSEAARPWARRYAIPCHESGVGSTRRKQNPHQWLVSDGCSAPPIPLRCFESGRIKQQVKVVASPRNHLNLLSLKRIFSTPSRYVLE